MIMPRAKIKNSNLIVYLNDSIQAAMEKITDNQRGAVAVVDNDWYLQGVAADGDIRRAMLRGATLMTPVNKIVNVNAISVTVSEVEAGRADEIFRAESSINILPVVDRYNKVIEVLIRNPGKRKEI